MKRFWEIIWWGDPVGGSKWCESLCRTSRHAQRALCNSILYISCPHLIFPNSGQLYKLSHTINIYFFPEHVFSTNTHFTTQYNMFGMCVDFVTCFNTFRQHLLSKLRSLTSTNSTFLISWVHFRYFEHIFAILSIFIDFWATLWHITIFMTYMWILFIYSTYFDKCIFKRRSITP